MMTDTDMMSAEDYVARTREYLAARPMYLHARRVVATLHFTDRTTVETEWTHDEILDILLAQVLLTEHGTIPMVRIGTRVAVEHVVSDRDTGSSLFAWPEPLALVEHVLAVALHDGGVVRVTLDFPEF